MSLELFNTNTSLSRKFSRELVGQALDLARRYGWSPRGTRPPAMFNSYALNADWFGMYLTNDGQTVTAEDAHALAEALECALHDIPDVESKMDWNPQLWADDLPEWLAPHERELIEDGLQEHALVAMRQHPYEFFAGVEKQYLMRFIRFCRMGSFTIL
ncbi:MAG: hypothetical protein ABI904_05190 [Chloroflexota bacterium]